MLLTECPGVTKGGWEKVSGCKKGAKRGEGTIHPNTLILSQTAQRDSLKGGFCKIFLKVAKKLHYTEGIGESVWVQKEARRGRRHNPPILSQTAQHLRGFLLRDDLVEKESRSPKLICASS